MENSIKITPLQWYAGVAEDMRSKLFLKVITPMEYYEKLTEALKTAMEQEKQQIIDAFAECWKANMPDGFECKLSAKEYYEESFKQD